MQLKGILSRNHHPLHHCFSLFADLGNVRTHVSSVKDALDSYNGGVWGLMSIANKLNSARNSICSARSELDSLEMMTGLDFEDWSEAYDELHSVMVDTLHSADGKSKHFDDAGVKPFAAALVRMFTEKNGDGSVQDVQGEWNDIRRPE